MRRMQKILIFQIGSLGDTIISMPCYREIVRRHPDAERYLLTNFPGKKMVPAELLLKPCGLIDGSVEYPIPLRGARDIAELCRKLRALRIDVLYYVSPEKHTINLLRHWVFFKACGIRKVKGVPWSRDRRFPRPLQDEILWESEASRLLRSIGAQQRPGAPNFQDRSLDLTDEERGAALRLISEVPALHRFVAVSVGGKTPINDWGNDNWRKALSSLSLEHPGLGAVFVGSADEWARNESLAAEWSGPKLNSCGRLTPRETAALIERAALFLGHDTGTLHLAAAVGTRIVGIFSARNVPGKWYSDRPGDRFFYNKPACFGCGLTETVQCPKQVMCMSSHKVEEVVAATSEFLGDVRQRESLACMTGSSAAAGEAR